VSSDSRRALADNKKNTYVGHAVDPGGIDLRTPITKFGGIVSEAARGGVIALALAWSRAERARMVEALGVVRVRALVGEQRSSVSLAAPFEVGTRLFVIRECAYIYTHHGLDTYMRAQKRQGMSGYRRDRVRADGGGFPNHWSRGGST
jgi:hypothetical protein